MLNNVSNRARMIAGMSIPLSGKVFRAELLTAISHPYNSESADSVPLGL